MRIRTCCIFVLAAALTGCLADYYEKQADRQVADLVRDREKKTLGYEPQVDTTVQPEDRKVTPSSFTRIPQTPLAPPAPAQVDELRVHIEYAPMGPKRFDWPSGGPTTRASASYTSLDERIRQRLTYGPTSPTQAPLRMDFFEALKFGVEHSREYQDQMEVLYLSALNVTLQRHLFSPRPFAGGAISLEGGQNETDYRAALTSTLRAGVRQKLPYGGEIVAQGLVTFINALDRNATSGEEASVVLSASIPLLRGAGFVNLEPLISGERQLIYQVRAFENYRRDFVIAVATQYFRLLNLQQSVIDRRLNYATYMTLTERSRALYAANRINFLELQRSLQELLTAENDVIDALETYTSALDDFKLLMGMATEQELEVVPVELDVQMPEITEEQAVELAMKYRLDYQTARDRVEDARRGVDNAKNGLLPDLDFTATATMGNRDRKVIASFEDWTNIYVARMELDLPIDRVAERNTYRQALINVRRNQRSLEGLRDLIGSDVRESIRLLRQSNLSLQIQRQGIELAQKRRDNAYELLRSGKSTSTRDLVEAQNALLRARDKYEQARATQQIQVLRFLRNSGTLRLDPAAGAIGHAMDRLGEISNAKPPLR